ncbi:MAG: archease [Thermoanaerobaculum sp.]
MARIRFRQLPHTADVRLAVYGKNEEELLRHLALGIGRLVLGRTPKGAPHTTSALPLTSPDLGARLVRVGNEVLFWLFTRRHATVDVALQGENARLHLRRLPPTVQPLFEIKAVTAHALKPRQDPQRGLVAVLTLDL